MSRLHIAMESVARCSHHCALLTQIMHDSLYINKTFYYVATLLCTGSFIIKVLSNLGRRLGDLSIFVLQGFHFSLYHTFNLLNLSHFEGQKHCVL